MIVMAFAAAAAQAAPPEALNPAAHVRGVVPAHNQASRSAGTVSNLTYHGGPVMHTNAVYAVFWSPSSNQIAPSYTGPIGQYFTDVAADSTRQTNVYYSDTQYTDSTGSAAYASSFNGAIVDTHSFPASGCRDRYTKICLTDKQIQAELTRVIGTTNPTGLGTEYFMFTPKGVGSCFGTSQCAFSYYCAYHGQIGSGSTATLYANMPYANTEPALCGPGQSPNGNDADATLNVTSHEHNETITDPLGNAWYDSAGNEDGDKCAWTFGTALGATSTGAYNQLINGHPYYLQREWSNASSGCVLSGV